MKDVTPKSIIVAAIMAAGLAWLTGFAFKLGDVEILLPGLWGQMVTAAIVAFVWAWIGPAIIKRAAVWSGLSLLAMALMLLRQMDMLSMSDEWMAVLSMIGAASISIYSGNSWFGRQSTDDHLPVGGDYHGP